MHLVFQKTTLDTVAVLCEKGVYVLVCLAMSEMFQTDWQNKSNLQQAETIKHSRGHL